MKFLWERLKSRFKRLRFRFLKYFYWGLPFVITFKLNKFYILYLGKHTDFLIFIHNRIWRLVNSCLQKTKEAQKVKRKLGDKNIVFIFTIILYIYKFLCLFPYKTKVFLKLATQKSRWGGWWRKRKKIIKFNREYYLWSFLF